MKMNVIAIVGAFCASFGALIISQSVEPWAWWLGQAMIVIGPLLMGSRAISSMNQPQQKENNEKQNQIDPR